jgi:hypothetical protein
LSWRVLGQLGKADLGIDDHRLHGGHVSKGLKDAHGVEDTEGFFILGAAEVAQAGGAPEHLVEQDAAAHLTQEDQVADLGDVDAGGQQVHGDGDIGLALVLVATDQLQGLSARR